MSTKTHVSDLELSVVIDLSSRHPKRASLVKPTEDDKKTHKIKSDTTSSQLDPAKTPIKKTTRRRLIPTIYHVILMMNHVIRTLV